LGHFRRHVEDVVGRAISADDAEGLVEHQEGAPQCAANVLGVVERILRQLLVLLAFSAACV
jgi:hypothetical protein